MDARTTCDEANELEKSGKASVRSRTHRLPNWPQRTAGKPLARFGALAPSAQAPLHPPARACCGQRQQHGRTCCMGMRARIRWHNMVICSSKVVVHESAGAAGALEGLRRLRVKEVAVAELTSMVQGDEVAVVGHSLVNGEVVPTETELGLWVQSIRGEGNEAFDLAAAAYSATSAGSSA